MAAEYPDIDAIATIIDEAAGETTRHQADEHVLRTLPPLLSDPTTENSEADRWNETQRSAAWAFGYRIEHETTDGRTRVVLAPYFAASFDQPIPPQAVPEVVDVWEALVGAVATPYGTARLQHVLFAARRGNGFARATAAAEAYLACADRWTQEYDRVGDHRTALALSRAVGNRDLRERIITRILDRAEATSAAEGGPPGPVLGYLELLAGEREVPDRYDELLDQAVITLSDPWLAERVHLLRRTRATDPAMRAKIDAERVRVWMDAAERADALVRSAHLKRALRIAESSGQPDLVAMAAAALQSINIDELGLASFSASSAIAREDIDAMVAPITAADTWQDALSVFAVFGPVTGNVDDNRSNAAEQVRNFVFTSILPREILGGDGLPRFMADSEANRPEMSLSEQETFRLQTFAPILAYTLNEIRAKHGVPWLDDLTAHFAQLPGVSDGIAAAMARCLQRYWTGDHEGAALAAAPRIETLARRLVVALNAGVYRLQRDQRPGQYPGLGVLLGVMRERGLDESWYRYLHTVTSNPAGWNLRNEIAHGFIDNVQGPLAAVLIQAMLFLSSLEPTAATDAPPPPDEPDVTNDPPAAPTA